MPSSQVSLSLQHKLTLTAIGLSGASVVTAPQSRAAIVTLPPSALPVASPTLDWDIDADGTSDFSLGGANEFRYFNEINGGRFVKRAEQPGVEAVGYFRSLEKLSSGVIVGASLAPIYEFLPSPNNVSIAFETPSTFQLAQGAIRGGWSVNTPGFFGFKFTNASGTHFGWGEMNIVAGTTTGFQITQVHYEDTPNASVTVGLVPEPSSVALLALGVAGLTSLRRRPIT